MKYAVEMRVVKYMFHAQYSFSVGLTVFEMMKRIYVIVAYCMYFPICYIRMLLQLSNPSK
jgi:hypothetical protein